MLIKNTKAVIPYLLQCVVRKFSFLDSFMVDPTQSIICLYPRNPCISVRSLRTVRIRQNNVFDPVLHGLHTGQLAIDIIDIVVAFDNIFPSLARVMTCCDL